MTDKIKELLMQFVDVNSAIQSQLSSEQCDRWEELDFDFDESANIQLYQQVDALATTYMNKVSELSAKFNKR
jgi:hypothetical protein